MKIKAVVALFYSRKDRAGNVYWSFRYTRTKDGKNVEGHISGGQSNILAALWELHPDHGYYWYEKDVPVRRFESDNRTWSYAGCAPSDIAKFIQAGLKKRVKKN